MSHINRVLVFPALACLLTACVAFAAEDNPAFKRLKYGIFIHHAWGKSAGPNPYYLTRNPDLSLPKSIDEVADKFDVSQFVRDLQAFRPDYITLTAWHAGMNPIFPSAAMDKWRGPGHAARRDVIGEVIRELRPTGIKLFLYVHFSLGMEMDEANQESTGWNESEGRRWEPGKFIRWNNFVNEVFDEMSARYAQDVVGYWIDGGYEKCDRQRLQRTVRKYNPKAEFVTGWDNAGWCNQFNRIVPPAPERGIPAATPSNPDTWPALRGNVNLLQGGSWWSTGGTAKVSPVGMLRYTVLQAGVNTEGGGVGWAADPYTDGTWEPNVREYFVMLGQLIKPIEEAIKNTLISTSFPSPQGSRIATLPHGIVATQSTDGLSEYIHVLRPPTGNEEKTRERYVNILQLPVPADGKTFAKAVVLTSGREVKMEQNERGIKLEVPRLDAWDPIDTVIKLTVQNPGTPSSATKAPP